ncbi:MAG: hypothetical protein Rubg2KO_35380 [Rubricoccaceae bacterium]
MMALTLRLLCLGLVFASLSAHAQTVVRLDPIFPVANQTARAKVTFSGTNPTRVTVFVRRVGETNFRTLQAFDEGGNEWGVDLPFDMPAQGVDVYAEYVQDGTTLTQPEQSPAQFPFRVPALNLIAQSEVGLPARQYRMVSVPLRLDSQDGLPFALGSGASLDVFGDDFGAEGDPAQWRLLRWAPGAQRYVDLVTEGEQAELRVRPGLGFWLITANGGTFDVERGLSTGVTIDGEQAFGTTEPVFLQTGWNQIGNPFSFPVRWDDVQGTGSVEDPIAYSGTYSNPQSTLQPWQGYFVFNPGRAVTLRFAALPLGEGLDRAASLAQRMRARAGAEASVLSVTAESGSLSDEVYLGLAKAIPSTGRPLHLRKPPPIDDGLRLVVQDAGEDWIGRFHTLDDAHWTLALTAPSNEGITLRLDIAGDWPDDVVVDDLDQGVELPVSGETVTVPALADVSTRRLQIRTGTASSQRQPLAFGQPWPNPSSGLVTVPYTLSEAGETRLEVLDVLGRSVRVLHEGPQDAGDHALPWDGLDATGRPVAAGTYLLRLEAGGQFATARVTRLR